MAAHRPASPLITVLMSAYNAEAFIQKAVQSILEQTCTDFEFIIINDGSTDATARILNSFTDARVHIITQANTGLTRALQKGLLLAQGTYVARIDADDIALPERLAQQAAFLRDNPETVLVGSNCHGIDETGTVKWTTNLPLRNAEIKWRLLFNNCLPHSTVMFRRQDVIALGGYNSDIPYAQDYELWFRLAEKHGFANLAQPLVYYRIPAPGTISCLHGDEQKRFARKTQENIFRMICPAVAGRYPEIEELGGALYFNVTPGDVVQAEALFETIHTAFCRSLYAAEIPASELNALRAEPYRRFAWDYFAQGSKEHFTRCIHEVLISTCQEYVDTPGIDLCGEEQSLADAAAEYFYLPQTGQQCLTKNNFFSGHYLHFAWKYYNTGDMNNFRRCLVRAFKNRRSLKILLLLLKSFAGKQVMDKLHAIRASKISCRETQREFPNEPTRQ